MYVYVLHGKQPATLWTFQFTPPSNFKNQEQTNEDGCLPGCCAM
jgi:hypothetical protein